MGQGDSAAVELDRLRVVYGSTVVLDDVSLSVGAGEIFGYLGPNGAGKTSTLDVLSTLRVPDGGAARVGGADVITQANLVRRSIGVVTQEQSIDHELRCLDVLRLQTLACGVPAAERTERITELLSVAGLLERGRDRVRDLSGGLRRRLEVVRALVHRPSVLLLDEPTEGIDARARLELWDYVRERQTIEGFTVLLATHYLTEAEWCDRVAILDEGRVVRCDTPGALKSGLCTDLVEFEVADAAATVTELAATWHITAEGDGISVRFSTPDAAHRVPELIRGLRQEVLGVRIVEPTLDDVFRDLTGRPARPKPDDV